MKISKYTKLIQKNNNYFIYNSFSNFFAEIDENLFNLLNKKQKSDVNKKDIGSEKIWDHLCQKRVITKSDIDDYLEYKSIIINQRRINNRLILTIAPTLNCNFSCPYCFEDKNETIMNDETIDNIINFVTQQKNIEQVDITWFGGEPLLASDVIEKITKKITDNNIPLVARIITNGYYLNENNLKLLERCNVRTIQLTIDGMQEEHNKKKFACNDNDTFSTIINNIDAFIKMNLNIRLTVRVNLNKGNMDSYPMVVDFFHKRYPNNTNIAIVPALIFENTKNNVRTPDMADADDRLEIFKKQAKKTNGHHYLYPVNSISECAIRNKNSMVIDAQGYIYKCWEIIGNEKYKVGYIDKEGVKVTNMAMLNRYLYGEDPFENNKCKKCFFLPICGGGCPHKRIENTFEKQSFDYCTHFQNKLEDYLFERYSFKAHK